MTGVLPEQGASSGNFGRGGDRKLSVVLDFFGTFGTDFVPYARARAALLDLKIDIVAKPDHTRVLAAGPAALLGAFEVACCLGPERSLVTEWTVRRL